MFFTNGKYPAYVKPKENITLIPPAVGISYKSTFVHPLRIGEM